MNHPATLKYAATHEWVKIENDLVITGITDHAQDALGDLVYVELPEVGREVTAGEAVAVLESVKTASDIHAPVSGVIVEVNEALEDDPDFINDAPYDKGWIYKIKANDLADVEQLLSNEVYEQGI